MIPIQNDKSKLQEPVKLPILIAHLGHMCMQLSMDVDLDIRLTTVFAKPRGMICVVVVVVVAVAVVVVVVVKTWERSPSKRFVNARGGPPLSKPNF